MRSIRRLERIYGMIRIMPTYAHVSNHKLHLEVAAIEDTCINASKEFSLESAMNKMDKEWEGIEFGTKVYKETGA